MVKEGLGRLIRAVHNGREEQWSDGDFDDDVSDIDTVDGEDEEVMGEGNGIVGRIAVNDWGLSGVCLEAL